MTFKESVLCLQHSSLISTLSQFDELVHSERSLLILVLMWEVILNWTAKLER